MEYWLGEALADVLMWVFNGWNPWYVKLFRFIFVLVLTIVVCVGIPLAIFWVYNTYFYTPPTQMEYLNKAVEFMKGLS